MLVYLFKIFCMLKVKNIIAIIVQQNVFIFQVQQNVLSMLEKIILVTNLELNTQVLDINLLSCIFNDFQRSWTL
jgi:hypothetical protein